MAQEEYEEGLSKQHLYMTLGEIKSDVKTLLTELPSLDTRVRHLEKKGWWTTGVYAAVAFLAAKVGVSDITSYFTH